MFRVENWPSVTTLPPRRGYMRLVEPHEGHMWALAAYVPRAFAWISDENASRLSSLNFPLPERANAKTLADFIAPKMKR